MRGGVEDCAVCAESMQQQTRWRKSVRAVIALNSMRENRKAPSVASADDEQEEPEEPRPGNHRLHVTCGKFPVKYRFLLHL